MLHNRLSEAMDFMHKARWRALWATVQALLLGEELWLTALGRARPGDAAPKHAIKAVDRLLGNAKLATEQPRVYAALCNLLLGRKSRPVVLVDTMEIRPRAYALTASIACDGRSFPIYSIVVTKCKPEGAVLRRFLRQLAEVLPMNCRPILVSDAGFETPWFDAVQEMGWDYVGRLRNRTHFYVAGRWTALPKLFKRATRRAKNLGLVRFPKRKTSSERRLVLSKRPQSKHRHRLTKKGRPGRRAQDRRCQKGANEPWLLATSLTCRPSQVVDLYALRMQIEETFRDTKCFRWGWSLRHARSRSHTRLEMLLLVAALAYFVQVCIGQAAEQLKLHYRHQANTIRKRRVLSFFLLGGLLLHCTDLERVTDRSLRKAIRELRKKVSALAPPKPG
jgi:hypothetical protein